jgi:hypothetical protein
MVTTITDATTYDLDSSYADLKHIAPLSEEEWRILLACVGQQQERRNQGSRE